MGAAAPITTGVPLAGAQPRAPSVPLATAGLTVLALAVFASESLAGVLQLDVSRAGELWRLVTCHFVHWDLEHLLWDLLMFASLAGLLEVRGRARLLCCVVVSAVAISLSVSVGASEIATYRGLSGIDSALFVLACGVLAREAWSGARRGRLVLLVLAAAGFVGKLAFELTTGGVLFVDSQAFTPVPLAHMVGAVVGGAVAVGWPHVEA